MVVSGKRLRAVPSENTFESKFMYASNEKKSMAQKARNCIAVGLGQGMRNKGGGAAHYTNIDFIFIHSAARCVVCCVLFPKIPLSVPHDDRAEDDDDGAAFV